MPIIVAAAIIEKDGKILITRRKAGAHQALKWEFPGGKLEAGESPEAALKRELREELNIEAEATGVYDVKLHAYPDREVLVLFYRARLVSGEPKPIDCDSLRWVNPVALSAYDFSGADAEVADKLAQTALKTTIEPQK